jgi:hypothetical protein
MFAYRFPFRHPLCKVRDNDGVGKGDTEMDGNPYWDGMVAAAFRRRPTATIMWLLTDYTVNKLIDLQEALEDKMREATGEP